jgi:hypothetical protein
VKFNWQPLSNAWNGKERRKAGRTASNQAVRILLPTKDVMIHGHLLNLSETGCCVDPVEPFLVWSELQVEIRFEVAQLQFCLAGVTRGSRGGKSFGVEFDSMTAERLAELKLLLPARKLPEDGIEAQLDFVELDLAASAAATGESAEESPSQKQGRLARAGKRAGLVRVEKPPGGKERRMHSRYIVEAQAILLLVKSGESMPGYILEISQSGCRIHLDGTFEQGIGAHVEVSFSIHGIPVRMAGMSQVLMDKHTVGIRFFNLSGRKQKQLNELITEIKDAIANLEYAG